jgi:MCP family monocarboxylic acid transporter-like MFS transporter 10
MTTFAYISAISVLIFWLPVNFYPTTAGLVIFALIFGFASGAFVSLMSACLIDIGGGHTSQLGAMLGTYMMVISLAALTGSPIEAAISGKETRQTGLTIFSGIAMLCGAGIINAAWLIWRKGEH